MTRTVDWYFDFVSPFSHLALYRLAALPADVRIRYRPVLFAGLLEHWQTKGPAEITPKRRWTYRWCNWLAGQWEIPFRMPAAHPFNPLSYLRLAIAAGSEPAVVKTIFDRLWTTGADPAEPALLAGLLEELGLSEADIRADPVRAELRSNTEEAARRDVFGVPTLVVHDEIFWGADAIPFACAYFGDPGVLDTPEMRRGDDLPVGVSR